MDVDLLVLVCVISSCSKRSTAVDSFLLSSMLPLGAELLEALHGNSNLIPNFKHYFTGLMLLAGSSKNEGHLSLVSAVASWLKLCASFAGSKPANVEEKQDPLVPATYLLQYLAHLTTAVQFSTNRARCSERISLANEGDILVQASPLQFVVLNCCILSCALPVYCVLVCLKCLHVGKASQRPACNTRLLNPNIGHARAKTHPSHSPCLSI